ncbi:MerR family transcriptional regulator [uncultured Methylobacterium sp.]|uniref:MerR family transcriptional regulator n=1 Tax=uncultured Methylobacterium sp. TaxID=157278 RepID=UPI0035CBB371
MALPALADEHGQADKHPGALRTITEVADDLDVPQHVLRFWETRFGQIRPMKRAGGRRYYRPADVELVAGIRHLLHVQRYTIAGAQRVLRENGVRFVQAVGRGEAVAAAPVVRETAADMDVPIRSHDAADPDRAALAEALRDLYACRAALAALRAPPEA